MSACDCHVASTSSTFLATLGGADPNGPAHLSRAGVRFGYVNSSANADYRHRPYFDREVIGRMHWRGIEAADARLAAGPRLDRLESSDDRRVDAQLPA